MKKNTFLSSHLVWIAWKLLFNRRTLFKGSTIFSFLGLVLGVASLVVSMSVMSGFEHTLQKATTDVTAHVQVLKRSKILDNWQDLESRIKTLEPSLIASTRFVFVEALMAKNGKISTVLIQGLDSNRMKEVLNFEQRLIMGEQNLAISAEGKPQVFLGKGLAKKMGVSVGDDIKVVVPIAEGLDSSQFKRNIVTFQVSAIMDLGKNDWNERFIVADLESAQEAAKIGDRYTGLLLKFADVNYARVASFHLSQALGAPYWVRDWRDANENLFEAVTMERMVIFFVVLVIVLVAAFNIASTLFVNVVQKYSDIAILKTVGMSEKTVLKIFSIQGVMIGILGLILGTILGIFLGYAFTLVQESLGLISGDVYKVDGIQVQFRFFDLVAVWVATLIICFIATLAPAHRGSKLNPVEGLRNG